MIRKSKNLVLNVLVASLVLFLSSCDALRNPEYYEEEIRDAFCYNIAKAMYYVDTESDYGLDFPTTCFAFTEDREERFFESVEDRAKKLIDDGFEETPYKRALQELSSSDKRAATVFSYYVSLPAHFSNYVRMSDELDFYVWKTTEINSKIPVKFMVNSEFYYEVQIDEEDAISYVLEQVFEAMFD